MPFVLDCSVTMTWAIEGQTSAYAEAVFERLESDVAFVPPLWRLEVASALLRAERRHEIPEVDSNSCLAALGRLPITVEADPADLPARVLALGRRHRLTAYDAAYADLALRRRLPIATLDDDLRRACTSLGIRLLP